MWLFYTVQNQQVYFASCRLKNVIKIGKLQLALKAFCWSWTYPDCYMTPFTILQQYGHLAAYRQGNCQSEVMLHNLMYVCPHEYLGFVSASGFPILITFSTCSFQSTLCLLIQSELIGVASCKKG